jgi:probable selenium-dependent hydroxylase accessory protein YqeC
MKTGILAEIDQLTEVTRGITIALVGAGGKTSLMVCLSKHLPGATVCTTSTKLSADEAEFFDRHFIWDSDSLVLPDFLGEIDNILITGDPNEVEGHIKLSGLTENQLIALKQICTENHRCLIVEADGSKRRPLKAPADWEPVIPAFSDLVIVVVGLAGLMKPLNEENVFRSQIFAQLTGLESGKAVDLKAILRYLKHPLGGLKGIPEKAKKYVLFNFARFDCPEFVDIELIDKELNGVFDHFFIEDVGLPS